MLKIIGFSAGVVGRDSNVDRMIKEIMDQTDYDAEFVKLTKRLYFPPNSSGLCLAVRRAGGMPAQR